MLENHLFAGCFPHKRLQNRTIQIISKWKYFENWQGGAPPARFGQNGAWSAGPGFYCLRTPSIICMVIRHVTCTHFMMYWTTWPSDSLVASPKVPPPLDIRRHDAVGRGVPRNPGCENFIGTRMRMTPCTVLTKTHRHFARFSPHLLI